MAGRARPCLTQRSTRAARTQSHHTWPHAPLFAGVDVWVTPPLCAARRRRCLSTTSQVVAAFAAFMILVPRKGCSIVRNSTTSKFHSAAQQCDASAALTCGERQLPGASVDGSRCLPSDDRVAARRVGFASVHASMAYLSVAIAARACAALAVVVAVLAALAGAVRRQVWVSRWPAFPKTCVMVLLAQFGTARAATHQVTPSIDWQSIVSSAATGDVVEFADGTYTAACSSSGTWHNQYDLSMLNVTATITLRAQNPGKAVLDADSVASSTECRVMRIHAPSGSTVEIHGLNITGGYTNSEVSCAPVHHAL